MRTLSIMSVLIMFPTAAMSGDFSSSFQKSWDSNRSVFEGRSRNFAITGQIGDNNSATSKQSGSNNISAIGQVGNGHVKSHEQTGNNQGHGSMQFTNGRTFSSSAIGGNSHVSIRLDFESR